MCTMLNVQVRRQKTTTIINGIEYYVFCIFVLYDKNKKYIMYIYQYFAGIPIMFGFMKASRIRRIVDAARSAIVIAYAHYTECSTRSNSNRNKYFFTYFLWYLMMSLGIICPYIAADLFSVEQSGDKIIWKGVGDESCWVLCTYKDIRLAPCMSVERNRPSLASKKCYRHIRCSQDYRYPNRWTLSHVF